MKSHGMLFAAGALVLLVAGCEPSGDDVRGELDVTPEATTLAGDETSVVLTADVAAGEATAEPIVYPLEWTVSDPALGRIVSQSASKVVYQHTARRSGSNAVHVRDGLGREGSATVTWVAVEE